MQNLYRGTILTLLFTIMSIPALAIDDSHFSGFGISQPPLMAQTESDSATVRVIPSEDSPGGQHLILITGLEANEEVSVRIIFEENGAEVYDNEATASQRGSLEIEIFTESDDEPGDYRVEVFNASGTLIGDDSFTITEPEEYSPIINISPLEADAGATFTIDISDIRPFVILEIFIENEDGEEIFSRRIRATVDGSALIVYESNIENTGTLNIRVTEEEITEIANQDVIVSTGFPATINFDPAEVMPGETVIASINGLNADEALSIEISLDDVIVTTIETTSNVSGFATFTYDFDADAARGIYEFSLFQNDEQVGFERLTVDILPLIIETTPSTIPLGTVFVARVGNLQVDEEVTIEFILDDEVLQSQIVQANAVGVARAIFGRELDFEIGFYNIRVLRSGEEPTSQEIQIIDEPDETISTDITASVEPDSATIPGIYTINVDGLPADTEIEIMILFAGESVASFTGTVDENGNYTTEIGTEESDEVGIYTIEIRVDGELVATTDLEAIDENADTESNEEDTEAEMGDISLSINPEILLRGERIEFIVTNLEPDETVSFELYFDGEVIYSATGTADATGTTAIALVAEDDEAFGSYEMRVLRDDEIIASDTFEIVENEDARNSAQISITPESGADGTDFIIVVTNLDTNEDIDLSVSFEDDVIFETNGTANDEGTATIRLSSDESDEIGRYEVTITRDSGEELDASFTITDREASIEITPPTGEIGTEHIVTVNGLEPDETISFNIEFEGESVYSVERNADSDGNFTITIATNEDEDSPGDYEIIIERANADDISATLQIIGNEAVTIDTPTIDSAVAIVVAPQSAEIGEEYEFTISGLESGEEFDIQVEFDNEIIYEASRTADVSGFFIITLDTDETDEAGTYTFSVLRAGEIVASTEFAVETNLVDNNTGNQIQSTNASVTAVIYTDAINIEFDADTSLQKVEFDGQAGDVIAVTVDSSNSLDTIATLISPDGLVIASDDDGGQGFDPEIERVVLPSTGIYTLEIQSFTAGDSGTAVITINRYDGNNALNDMETHTITLNEKITGDVLTYFAQAGDILSLEIELESGNIGDLYITAEQTETILMTYQTSGLPQLVTLGFVVPETGNIVIHLGSDSTANAILNISITRE